MRIEALKSKIRTAKSIEDEVNCRMQSPPRGFRGGIK